MPSPQHAAPVDPNPDATQTSPISSRRLPRAPLLVCLILTSILDMLVWIIFIAAFVINAKLNDKYFAYINAGEKVPPGVDYPPLPSQGIDADLGATLVVCLLPLTYDTAFLLVVFVWATCKRPNTVFILCVSVLAFLMWIVCGSFNALHHYAAQEQTWDPAFNSLFGWFAALQIVVGVSWLFVLVAAAKSIHKERDKWVAEGVQRGVTRALEELQMDDLPAYRA